MKIICPKTSSEDLKKKQLEFLEKANAAKVNFTKKIVYETIFGVSFILAIVLLVVFVALLIYSSSLPIKIIVAFVAFILFITTVFSISTVTDKIYPAEEQFNKNNGLLILVGGRTFYLDNPNWPQTLNQPLDRYLRFLMKIERLKKLKKQTPLKFQFKGWSGGFQNDTVYDVSVNNKRFTELYIPTEPEEFYKASIGDFSYIDDYIEKLFESAYEELETLKDKLA